MRKRTINYLFDEIMWYLIYLLPLFLYLLLIVRTGNMVDFAETFSSFGLDVVSDNIVFSSLSSIFGSNGVMPLFSNTGILFYMSYFVNVFVIHLAVDFLLFIPRLAHKWLNCLWGNKE